MLDGICGPAQAEQRHQCNDDGHRNNPPDGMTVHPHRESVCRDRDEATACSREQEEPWWSQGQRRYGPVVSFKLSGVLLRDALRMAASIIK